jgi:peptidoglycan/xylan/chitin deacetylase (PgdA/CDA1 family)
VGKKGVYIKVKKLALSAAALLVSLGLLGSMVLTNAAPVNLITNPSVETNANNLPTGWANSKQGSNTTAFSYLATGHTGGHSLKVQMTSRSGGNARWYFNPITVSPNTTYTFTDWYQSNVTTHIRGVVTATDGSVSNLNASDIASSSAWKQATVSITTPANAKTLTVYHYLNAVGQLTTDDFDLEAPVVVPPTVQVTAPAANAVVSGTQTITATATDSNGIKNVQFKLDGANLGTADTTAPYSVSWNTKTTTNASHILSAVVTNTANVVATAANVTVTVNNPTAPTVSISAPVAGSTVSGATVPVNATASADTIGVQFKLDNANLGAEDTTAPYSVNLNTTTLTNASHSLTAVARNAAALSTTSAAVAVTVNNPVVTPPTPPTTPPTANLIANPSFETASGTAPASWLSSNWGTNTSTFSYLNTGHTGGHSVKVQTTSFTNGAANWYYTDIPVTVGKTYKYENWYQSNVDTEVDAEVLMSDGTVQYFWLGTVLANTNWTKFTTTFTVPAGAKSIAIYQLLAKVGYIVSDDYSLSEYTPLPFNRGIVSVTFDDGWANQHTNALPLLKKYALPSTFYIISGELNDQPDYMSVAQIQDLQGAGAEIASHSVTHPDLTTLSQTQLVNEMSNSKTTLQGSFGGQVTDFAYPFGAYNANTITVGKQYYQSQRSVNQGLNTRDNWDLTQLKIYEVDSNISQAQVQGWVQAAIAQKSWLILVFHEIAVTPTDPTDALYTTQPSDLDAELGYIKTSGVSVETVHQAINEILPQL